MPELIANSTAQGPYSTVMAAGDLVFLAGQGGLDPETGNVPHRGIEAETARTIANIELLLGGAGCTLADLVQVNCYLADIDDLARFNDAYATAMGPEIRPTRTTFGVGALPFDLKVEITCIAHRST
jgi:2-iminobutanoate/2-iminopropanoate deaminase